jgi:hypothetical protein
MLVSGLTGCRTDALLGRNSAAGGSAAASSVDGSTPDCQPTPCADRFYACGDCLDNDADGRVDTADPECLGACDDEEELLSTGIPGQNQSQCRMDCYFDNDSGGGNDQCQWDHRCDPLSVAPDFPPSGDDACAYDPAFIVDTSTCGEAESSQPQPCLDVCLTLTPNGCDCFGCCEIPRDSGQFVWIGNEVDGVGTCELALLSDSSACPPCTPVSGCQNPCEGCERCIGEEAPTTACAPGGDGGP